MRIIESDRLFLREFSAGDLVAMEAVLGDLEVMRFSDDGIMTTPQIRDWIQRQISGYQNTEGLGRWAITEQRKGTVIGYAGLTREAGRCEAGEVELGFRLAPAFWGLGYATEAAAAAIAYGFAAARRRRIIAIVDPGNGASVRVIEKLGMRFEAEISFPGYTHPDWKYTLSRPDSKPASPARAASYPPTVSRRRPATDDRT